MELAPGFKLSEAGPIPEDWEAQSLLDHNGLISGQHVMAAFVNARAVGTPYLTGPSDFENGRISLSKWTTAPTKMCEPGDTLVTVKGSGVGLIASADREYCISRQLMAVRPRTWHPHFVYLGVGLVLEQVKGEAAGTIPGLSRADFAALKIAVPSVDEQRAIAAALADVDAWIAEAEAEAAKLAGVKAAAMDALLTATTRLPGFSGDWDIELLGDHLEFKNGISKAGHYFGHGSPIVNYMDVFNQSHLVLERIGGKVSATREEIGRFSIQCGDVLFTRTSETPEEIGMASVVIDKRPNVVFSGFVLRGRPTTSAFDSMFLGYLLRSASARRQIEARATYTTRALTNGGMLSLTTVVRPPLAEQRAIAAVLSDIDVALEAAKAVAEKSRGVKAAAMDALLSGRVRLPPFGPAQNRTTTDAQEAA